MHRCSGGGRHRCGAAAPGAATPGLGRAAGACTGGPAARFGSGGTDAKSGTGDPAASGGFLGTGSCRRERGGPGGGVAAGSRSNAGESRGHASRRAEPAGVHPAGHDHSPAPGAAPETSLRGPLSSAGILCAGGSTLGCITWQNGAAKPDLHGLCTPSETGPRHCPQICSRVLLFGWHSFFISAPGMPQAVPAASSAPTAADAEAQAAALELLRHAHYLYKAAIVRLPALARMGPSAGSLARLDELLVRCIPHFTATNFSLWMIRIPPPGGFAMWAQPEKWNEEASRCGSGCPCQNDRMV